ncbi:phospholipase DDHD1 isoform X3 [Anas platyrhynchos]|uniref:phospholipase DDHD1 isoform X3 n=1 Tax=Anas platyrhynchos TaxID=8839 RepID=UPI000F7C2A21|eukprot:XP_027313874.1 phospholipase DDHD1 isoform X4 [Anas platyrhynchos]
MRSRPRTNGGAGAGAGSGGCGSREPGGAGAAEVKRGEEGEGAVRRAPGGMDYPEPQGVWDLPGEGGGESGGGGSGGGCYGQEEEEEEEEEESRGVEHPLVRPPRRHHLHHQHHQQHQQHHQQQQLRAALSTSSSEGEPEAAPPRQLSLSDSAGGGEFDSAESGASLRYSTGTGGEGSEGAGLASSESGGSGFAPAASALPERKRPRSAAAGGGGGGRPRYEVVRELGAEEVRWFYREDRKTWKPFIGYDSLRIELAFRALGPEPREEGEAVEPVCVRSGLYEVDVVNAECYPVYWNQTEKIPVMRGQWFIDGTWQPLEEEESNLIEQEHLNRFRGQQLQESFDMEVSKPVDGKEVHYYLPPFSLPSLFKWRGYKENSDAACLKRKRSQAIHSLKLSRNHVDWHSVDEVYLYSDATTSKIARTVTQKLGFSKASSSGTRLHRGYVEEATLEDKPPQTSHIVFVVHGIGQKMDQGRIIKNTAMMRDTARKIEEKYFSNLATHVEFLPVEWRSKLTLDGDTVDSITPDKVRGLRDMLNSSAMDIMYYTSPLYRDELVKGLQQELNRLYTLFCSRNPEFEEKGGKVSIVSHSLGCVITYDIMTGWNPVRLYEQLLQKEEEELEESWMSYEEQRLLEELYITKQRLREIEERLQGLKASTISKTPVLKFKVENFFCMGSPLAVFLALRGIRPGNSGSQDHILPRTICNRLLNIFHPTDPVAYRLEPLILKHYSNISPVQIHWYNTANPLPYEHMKPSFLNPTKEPTSVTDGESASTVPSPTTSPVMVRRHYGESITNIGKASILGAASIGKGLGGMLFSRFGRSSTTQPPEAGKDGGEGDDKRATTVGTPPFSQSSSAFLEPTLELEHRIDFELREGLVESRYWSAVTSHTAYWSSLDIALFLLTFMYKHDQDDTDKSNLDAI